MANWFALQQLARQVKNAQKKKGLILSVIISSILIFSGSWLIWYTLGLRGYSPFRASHITLKQEKFSYFSPTVQFWAEEIEVWAEAWSLDPILIATVMQIESCGDPQVVSPAGAQGLFQVMPYHFAPDEDMLDPQTNANRGLSYLSESYNRSKGDIRLTLAGYNGGHGQIERKQAQWPDETQRYAQWGWGIYKDVLFNNDHGDTLEVWLKAGGWHLCQQAKNTLDLP